LRPLREHSAHDANPILEETGAAAYDVWMTSS
jgi:hypothetical protein